MHSEPTRIPQNTLKLLSIRLKSPYLSTKIEPESIKKVLNSTHNTFYQLLMVTNGIKEVQHFAEINSEDYWLTAYVKTEAAPIGEVKKQVWGITHLQPLLKKRPKYTIRCSLTEKMSNKEIYKCSFESIKTAIIYNQIQECINDLENILNETDITYGKN